MPKDAAARLGQLMVAAGVVGGNRLESGNAAKARTALELARGLIADGALSEDAFTGFLAKYCRVPFTSLLDQIVKANAHNVLPARLCLELKVLPVSITEDDLTIAMVNPMDTDALERIREHCPNRTIRPIGCGVEQFSAVAKRSFASEPGLAEALEGLDKRSTESAEAFMARIVETLEEEQRIAFVEQSAMNTLTAMADKIPLFQGVPPMDVASLLSIGMIEEYAAGRSIFQKGSGGGELYVVLSGRVTIRDGEKTLATMGPGDVFGELALLADTTRTASAVAEEPSAVLTLSEADFDSLIQGQWGARVLRNLFGLMAGRLQRMNERIRELESR